MTTRARPDGNRRGGLRRRLVWTLALALWLPLAQALAWSHGLAHHTQRSDSGLAFDASCATCLAAASLHGCAPPAAPPQVATPAPVQPPPPALTRAPHRHADTLAYRSRAPPALT